jgi:hypothetical protein
MGGPALYGEEPVRCAADRTVAQWWLRIFWSYFPTTGFRNPEIGFYGTVGGFLNRIPLTRETDSSFFWLMAQFGGHAILLPSFVPRHTKKKKIDSKN